MHFNQRNKWSLVAALVVSIGHATAMAKDEGRIVTVVGQVTVNGAPAKAGDVVPAGGTIETKNGASASLIFGTENVVKLSSNSIIAVETSKAGSAVLNLSQGNVDGVKKMGSKDNTAIIVKTEAAAFELTGGRYSVGSSADGRESKFVAVDGNALVTYSSSTSTKPGEKVYLKEPSMVQVTPSVNGGPSQKTPSFTKLTQTEAQNLRPSVNLQPTKEQIAQQTVTAIVSAPAPAAPPPGRTVASTELAPLQPTPEVIRAPALPRDPLQTIPGRTKAAVSIIFQP